MSHCSINSYCLRNARWGTKFPNDLPLKDSLWETLTDSFCKMPMANTAEKLAAQFGITRAQCDEFALRSQVPNNPDSYMTHASFLLHAHALFLLFVPPDPFLVSSPYRLVGLPPKKLEFSRAKSPPSLSKAKK